MQTKFYFAIIACFASISMQAQTFYTQDFNTVADFGRPTGWTSKIFNVYPGRGNNNSKGMQSSFGSSASTDTLASGFMVMPSPPAVYAPIVLNFNYRVADYIGSTVVAAPLPAGSRIEAYVQQNGGANILLKSITQGPNTAIYLPSGELELPDFYGREIKLIFKVINTGGSGASYVVQLDDITLGIQLQAVAVETKQAAKTSMTIAPNRIQNGQFTMRFEGFSNKQTEVRISDMSGKLVATKTIQVVENQPITIDAPSAQGVYLVSAISAEGILSERIIVE